MDNFQSKSTDIITAYETASFDTNKCNPIAMSIETCGFLQLLQNCPKNAWTDSEHCSEWKSFAGKCWTNINAIIKLNNVSMDDLKEEVFV